MKDKIKSIILVCFISFIMVPSFIYGAVPNQSNSKERTDKVLSFIEAIPREVHLSKGSNEQVLRDMIEVKAYYKGYKEPVLITQYKTNYEKQKNKKDKCSVWIMYTENGCTKKTCITVIFCKPSECEPVTPTPSQPPTQTPSQPPNEEDINFPFVSGYTDRTFKPNQAVTREELATMLARLITKNQIPRETNQYTDLSEGRFSTDAINYITKLGIMDPATATTFAPFEPVSYSEFNQIVSRLRPYIKNPDVTLPSGSGNLTRVQAVVALNDLFNVQCSTSFVSSPYQDVSESDPNYADIICATQPRN